MKLKEWAKSMGMSYQTVWNMYKAKRIPGAYQLPTGTIVVPDNISDLLKEAFEHQQKEIELSKLQKLVNEGKRT